MFLSSCRRSTHLHHSGFTLIELVIVIAIIAIALGLFSVNSSSAAFWREEGFIRKFTETLTFLHHQAVADQSFYRIEFDLDNDNYKIGVMKSEEDVDQSLKDQALTAGNLTLELASFLSPSLGQNQTMIPPPNYPSLGEPVALPINSHFEDVKTATKTYSRQQGGKAAILFSPRGFSDFAVIHLKLRDNPVTVLVNPWTGVPEIYRQYKEFEWTYGQKKKS